MFSASLRYDRHKLYFKISRYLFYNLHNLTCKSNISHEKLKFRLIGLALSALNKSTTEKEVDLCSLRTHLQKEVQLEFLILKFPSAAALQD